MIARAREGRTDFGTDEAPTKPHTMPLEDRLGPDLPGPRRPPSQKMRKVVVRKVSSGTMPAVKPVLSMPAPRDAVTIPAPPLPPPETIPAPPGPEAIVPAPIVMVSAPSIPTPFVPMQPLPLPPVPSSLPPCDSVTPSSPDLLPILDREKEEDESPPVVKRRRWAPRVALLLVLVGGELAYAEHTGAIQLPPEVGHARAMLVRVLGLQ